MSTRTATQTEPTYFFDDIFEDWDAQDEPAARRASPPPTIAIVIIIALILTVCIGTLVAIGVIAAPGPATDAANSTTSASGIATESDSAALLSAAGIETTVSRLWTESGQSGTVACPAVFSTAPGTLVTCSGVLEGNPLNFTVAIAKPSAGHIPFTFASWTSPRKV